MSNLWNDSLLLRENFSNIFWGMFRCMNAGARVAHGKVSKHGVSELCTLADSIRSSAGRLANAGPGDLGSGTQKRVMLACLGTLSASSRAFTSCIAFLFRCFLVLHFLRSASG